jgi:hypothetical protein
VHAVWSASGKGNGNRNGSKDGRVVGCLEALTRRSGTIGGEGMVCKRQPSHAALLFRKLLLSIFENILGFKILFKFDFDLKPYFEKKL